MKKTLTLLIIAISFTACSQSKTYYDADWKETTKEKASYYRDQPKKENGVWLIKDYYISGEKQFVGHTKDSLATIFEGDVTWYFKTGKVLNKVRYKNGKTIGFFTVTKGSKGSKKDGWFEKDLFFVDNSSIESAANAKRYSTSTSEYYYANTSRIAIQHTYNVGYKDKFSFTHYFNKKGDTIARLDKNSSSDKWLGNEVVFYEEEMRGRNDMNSIKQINTYNKGVVTHSQHFNTDEKQIANGSFKNEKPFTGTFLTEVCRLRKIRQYENGSLLKEITYNNEDKKIGEISFKNGMPNTGIFYNCYSLETYENGKLHGKSIQYLYADSESIQSEFIFKNGLKHGDYTIYQGKSLLLEKGTYKNGMQTGEVFYYYNGVGEEPNYYYLKANVKIKNNKPFISEFSQFNSDDNTLIKTFKLKKNNTDKFTYINNGYHSISANDLNSDGFDDLKITYYHYLHDVSLYTYYVFNSKTGKYEHLPELDNADNIEIDVSENTLKVTYDKEFELQKLHITYDFSTNKLIKKSAIEEVHHQEGDTTLITQIFPVQLNRYPLLADNLPPIKFIQGNNEQQIISAYQKIILKKESFLVTFPGLVNDKQPPYGFNVKVTASYNKDVFKKTTVDLRMEETSIFGYGTSFAYDPNNPMLFIGADGHNIFYYDNTSYDTLDAIKNSNEKVLLLQFSIDKMHYETKEIPISEIDKPIYMIMYMDKNENLKIDKNEIHYITVEFE